MSSGVPRVKESMRQLADRYLDFDPVMIEPGVRTGIAILAENPKEVGADRIANSVAAFDLFGGPTIVADFGTATTCDAVSAKGEYLGGAIAPGIGISMDALVGRAAALGAVELIEPRSVLGKTTVECIQSGAVYGFAAQVDGLCERIQRELGECTIVSTGGLADLITPLSTYIDHASRGSPSTASASSTRRTSDWLSGRRLPPRASPSWCHVASGFTDTGSPVAGSLRALRHPGVTSTSGFTDTGSSGSQAPRVRFGHGTGSPVAGSLRALRHPGVRSTSGFTPFRRVEPNREVLVTCRRPLP